MEVIRMSWEDILKNIEINRKEFCCEEARVKIMEYFEKYAELAGKRGNKDLKESLISTATILSEESCDELRESVRRFQGMWDLDKSDLFDAYELRDIMDDWWRCEKEPKEIGQRRKDPKYDVNQVFAENPAGWMDEYIRR
jgi:hypothetical protein